MRSRSCIEDFEVEREARRADPSNEEDTTLAQELEPVAKRSFRWYCGIALFVVLIVSDVLFLLLNFFFLPVEYNF
jgi:hypothetical protein